MSVLVNILAPLPVVIAIIAAYYFGKVLEDSFDIHKPLVLGILMIAFGIFVWWVIVQYVFPAVGVMLGWDKIPYQP